MDDFTDDELLAEKMRNSVMDDDDDLPNLTTISHNDDFVNSLSADEKVAYYLSKENYAMADVTISGNHNTINADDIYTQLNTTTRMEMYRNAARTNKENIIRAFIDCVSTDILMATLRDACLNGRVDIVNILLSRDDDIDFTDGEFHNVRVASSRKHIEVVKTFLRNPRFRDAAVFAIIEDTAHSMKSRSFSILHYLVEISCQNGFVDILEIIRGLCPPSNLSAFINNGIPLRTAISSRQTDALKILIAIPGVIDAADELLMKDLVKVLPHDEAIQLQNKYPHKFTKVSVQQVIPEDYIAEPSKYTKVFRLMTTQTNIHTITTITIEKEELLECFVRYGDKVLYDFMTSPTTNIFIPIVGDLFVEFVVTAKKYESLPQSVNYILVPLPQPQKQIEYPVFVQMQNALIPYMKIIKLNKWIMAPVFDAPPSLYEQLTTNVYYKFIN